MRAAEDERGGEAGESEANDFGSHIGDGVAGWEAVPVPVGDVGG